MKKTEFSHFGKEKIIKEGHGYTQYELTVKEGKGIASTYPVFPGIQISVIEIKGQGIVPSIHGNGNIIELNHCLKGRIECQMKDGCLQYIGEGDIFLNTWDNHSTCLDTPLGEYKGIVITIDMDQANEEVHKAFPDLPFTVSKGIEHFFKEDKCFLIQAKSEIERLFLDMYTVEEEVKTLYFQLKMIEILMYLNYFDVTKEIQKGVFTRPQIEIAKEVQRQMISDPHKRYTIEELAQQHCISTTALKTYFKEVYGVPIATYMKEYRIKYAAKLLRETDETILSIALAVGYESQSKFGKVFKDIIKLTPMKYRKKYK